MSYEAEVGRLERNLERFKASKVNMEAKKRKHSGDPIVVDWTTREIASLDDRVAKAQAELDALK